MTEGMREYLAAMTPDQRKREAAKCRKVIRVCWPERHTFRNRRTVVLNVRMLRNLREF